MTVELTACFPVLQYTGLVLRAFKRLQVNLYLQPIDNVTYVLYWQCHVRSLSTMSRTFSIDNVTYILYRQCHIRSLSTMSRTFSIDNVTYILYRQCNVRSLSTMSRTFSIDNVTYVLYRQCHVRFLSTMSRTFSDSLRTMDCMHLVLMEYVLLMC